MIKKLLTINLIFFTASCSYLTGPEGYFPSTKDDFLKENVEEDIYLPENLELTFIENHYPFHILYEYPSYIYSWSIGHILEYEFFC